MSGKSEKSTPGAEPDKLAYLTALRAATRDDARAEEVARLHKRGRRTARESIAAFLGDAPFSEYGQLAQPGRRDMEGAADGLVTGFAMVDGMPVALAAYDMSVYAGTQSAVNHLKLDRLLDLARERRWPLVGWFNGGGMRPQDTASDAIGVRPPNTSFVGIARLSGWVPTVAIVAGPTFAGNASLAGLCDLMIATQGASLGMAGPALTKAALGQDLKPEQIGPVEMHVTNGVVDVACDTLDAAANIARQYLALLLRDEAAWKEPDVSTLRSAMPASPRRAYNVRRVIEGIVDIDSALELRSGFGRSLVTTLARVRGRTVGVLANQPLVGGGALDSDSADKAARFIQLCDAYDLPMLFLCDTPGFMCGPDAEATALVRHSSRMMCALANATVPFMTVQLRKAYGLGYFMMGSASLKPLLLLAWPTAEYGAMGVEGAVDLMHGKAIEAAEPDAREALRAGYIQAMRSDSSAFAYARRFAVDDVIDPAETRERIALALASAPRPPRKEQRKRVVDTW